MRNRFWKPVKVMPKNFWFPRSESILSSGNENVRLLSQQKVSRSARLIASWRRKAISLVVVPMPLGQFQEDPRYIASSFSCLPVERKEWKPFGRTYLKCSCTWPIIESKIKGMAIPYSTGNMSISINAEVHQFPPAPCAIGREYHQPNAFEFQKIFCDPSRPNWSHID